MKKSEKIILIIQLLLLGIVLLNFWQPIILQKFSLQILLMIIVLLILFLGIDLKKSIRQHQNLYYILVGLILYFMASYIFGLYIGFNRTIYSHTIKGLFTNIVPVLLTICMIEIIRYQSIQKTNKNKWIIVLTTFVITLYECSYVFPYYNFASTDDLYEFIGLAILGGISKNIFLSILCATTDYINPIVYRVITEIYVYIVPIIPAFGPYVTSVINIVLPTILAYVTITKAKTKKNAKPMDTQKRKTIDYIIMAILLVIVAINSGFFRFQSFVIGSNSMYPTYQKGDVLIIDKGINKLDIKEGEVLVFRYKEKIITHRVFEVIKKNNTTYYRTKGDNNPQADDNIVEQKDIVGVGKTIIKKIGYPSLMLSEGMKG